MENLFSLVIIIIIISSILSKKKRRHERDTAASKPRQDIAKAFNASADSSTAKKMHSAAKNSGVHPDMPVRVPSTGRKDGKVSSTLRDDRYNDWLARQLRDERNSLIRLREMFGFRMQGKNLTDAELLKEFHAGHCDAELLKESHAERCDAGRVDRAAGQ